MSKVPQALKSLQHWFASIITTPIDLESRIYPITPSGNPIEEEACHYVAPSHNLKPHQRMQIYNQQYWWRLLNNLHDTLPLLVRLFGYIDFNQTIGIPYLKAYPFEHWSLSNLCDRLPDWLEGSYQADDRELICNAGAIDVAYNRLFVSPSRPFLQRGEQKLILQSAVSLFNMPYDLFSFRDQVLKEKPDYWVDQDFPDLKKEKQYFFTLHRNRKNVVVWREIELEAYLILQQIKQGRTVDEVCAFIETQEESFQEKAAEMLTSWFQQWTAEGLLALDH